MERRGEGQKGARIKRKTGGCKLRKLEEHKWVDGDVNKKK